MVFDTREVCKVHAKISLAAFSDLSDVSYLGSYILSKMSGEDRDKSPSSVASCFRFEMLLHRVSIQNSA